MVFNIKGHSLVKGELKAKFNYFIPYSLDLVVVNFYLPLQPCFDFKKKVFTVISALGIAAQNWWVSGH